MKLVKLTCCAFAFAVAGCGAEEPQGFFVGYCPTPEEVGGVAGGPSPELFHAFDGYVPQIVASPTATFWLEGKSGNWTIYRDQAGEIVPIAQGVRGGLRLDSENLYWVDGDWRIRTMRQSGDGEGRILVEGPAGHPHVGNGYLFWESTEEEIWRMDLAGGEREMLVAGPGDVRQIASNSDAMYWVGTVDGVRYLRKRSNDGGAITELWTGDHYHSMTVVEDSLFLDDPSAAKVIQTARRN